MEQKMPPPNQMPPSQYQPQASGAGLAKASLILGIIGLVMSCTLILAFIGFILGLLALIFGAVSYWGMTRDRNGYYGFILGLLAMILAFLIPIIIALISYAWVSSMI